MTCKVSDRAVGMSGEDNVAIIRKMNEAKRRGCDGKV